MSIVVMERLHEDPPTEEEIQEMKKQATPCFEVNGVELVRGLVSLDRKHFVCIFEAPDAAAVRRAVESAGVPYERIWSANEI